MADKHQEDNHWVEKQGEKHMVDKQEADKFQRD